MSNGPDLHRSVYEIFVIFWSLKVVSQS